MCACVCVCVKEDTGGLVSHPRRYERNGGVAPPIRFSLALFLSLSLSLCSRCSEINAGGIVFYVHRLA